MPCGIEPLPNEPVISSLALNCNHLEVLSLGERSSTSVTSGF